MDYSNGCDSGFCSWSTDPFHDCQPASPPETEEHRVPLLLYDLQQTVYTNQVDAVDPLCGATTGHRTGPGPSEWLPYENELPTEDWQSLDDLLFSAFDEHDKSDAVACPSTVPPLSGAGGGFGLLSRNDADENVKNDEKQQESCRKRRQKLKNRNLVARKRRNEISVKIDTLHALVPNSVKRDKASMLDDVVEYMKSLQQRLQRASGQLSSSNTSHLAHVAGEAYFVGCLNYLSPLMQQAWQNGMLRPFGNAELQQRAISHVSLPSPFPQPFVFGASAMPLIQGDLPLWPPIHSSTASCPHELELQRPGHFSEQSQPINMPIQPEPSASQLNPGM